jgi:hypothetical protein
MLRYLSLNVCEYCNGVYEPRVVGQCYCRRHCRPISDTTRAEFENAHAHQTRWEHHPKPGQEPSTLRAFPGDDG